MADKQFPHCFEFTPSELVIVPTVEGQSRVLPNGNVKAWFTDDQWQDVYHLVNGVLDGASNLMEHHNEVVAELAF